MNRALWIVQGLLSALFLFGGVVKLTMPIDEIAAMMGLQPDGGPTSPTFADHPFVALD